MAQRLPVWNLLRGQRYVPLPHGTDAPRSSTASDRDDREQSPTISMDMLLPMVNVFGVGTTGLPPMNWLRDPHVRPFPRVVDEGAFNLDALSKFANSFTLAVNHKPTTREMGCQTTASSPPTPKDVEVARECDRVLGIEFLDSGMYKDAIWYLTQASEAGDPEAQRRLADCYHQGLGVHVDQVTAFELWEKAARGGDVDSMYQRAVCVMRGIGLTVEQRAARDEKAARAQGLALMEDAANKGQPDAAYYMAVQKIVKGDFEASRPFLRKAVRAPKFADRIEDWLDDRTFDKRAKAIVREVFNEMDPDDIYPPDSSDSEVEIATGDKPSTSRRH